MKRTFFLSAMLTVAFTFYSCNAKSQNTTTERVVATQTQNSNGKIQVVFLLDATGSMSGLISTAKEKIWSIVGSLSQTEQVELEIGMLFYRDRGDEFITKIIPLGTNMDALYEELMKMQATGGGDTPESVNQALHEGVTKMTWDMNKNTYRAIFLVGDAPPHMDYKDDVKYPVTCKLAKEKQIIINTILMGNAQDAKKIWQEIAQNTGGEFIQTDMSVNNIAVTTPYDKEISEKQYKLDNTRVYYGSEKEQAATETKKIQSEKIKSSDASVAARRSDYNLSKTGKESYYGSQELANDVMNGKKLSEIPKKELPKELQEMSESDLKLYVENMISERKKLETEIVQLNNQRQEYINKEIEKMDDAKVENSFDDVIFNAVKSQTEKVNINLEGKAKR